MKKILLLHFFLLSEIFLFAAGNDSIFVNLYNTSRPANGKFSPNGEQFLYTLSSTNIETKKNTSELYLVNFNEGRSSVKIIEKKATGYHSISWLGREKIAFLRDMGLGTQIFTQEIEGTKPTQVTKNPTSILQYQFNPQNTFVYFIAEDTTSANDEHEMVENSNSYYFEENKKNTSLYEYDLVKKQRKKITFGLAVKSFIYSSEKQLIAFTAYSKPYASFEYSSEIYLLDLNTRGVKRLTRNSIIEKQLRWGAGASSILFTAACNEDLEPYYQESIFRIDVNDSMTEDLLPDFEYQVVSYTQNQDKKKIYFIANRGVVQQLFSYDFETKLTTQLTDFKGVVKDILMNGDKLIMLYSDPLTPEDYYVTDLNKINFSRLTNSNKTLQKTRLPVYHVLDWISNDGTKIQGILIVPAKYDRKRKYPLIVQLHGGPNSSNQLEYSNSWVTYPQILTDQGYMVFQPNYRGSTGYGDKFMRGIIGDFFKLGTEDILSGIEFLTENGIVDDSKLAIMGYSAGAHFTNWIITQTDIFKAALSHAGLSNWLSFYAQTEVPYLREIWLNNIPYENTEFLLESSPINYITNVTTPTLFICGENDKRVPYTQSLEMYRGLMRYNIPSRLLLFPKEGHVLTGIKAQLYKISQELNWLSKYIN